MTVTIYFTESLLDNLSEINKNCFSIYSPLNEVLGSLHVLLNPDGHGLMTTWASETKQIMDEQILQELNYFSPFYKSKIPNFFIEEIIYEESSIEKQISLLGTNLLGKANGRSNRKCGSGIPKLFFISKNVLQILFQRLRSKNGCIQCA